MNSTHIAPVALTLRGLESITVNFTSGRLQDLGIDSLGQTQKIQCAHETDLGGLDGIELVVYRTA